jgi:hypothetical protein
MSFVLDDDRTEDVGVALNQEGIAVRSGHHCAQPILRRMGVESTVRPSLAFYNTGEDIDAPVAVLLRLQAGRDIANCNLSGSEIKHFSFPYVLDLVVDIFHNPLEGRG